MSIQNISIRGARQHNLKNLDLEIPRNTLTVITGLSGSGKSSLAFDTLYAEGQRRYIESLSTYARQFLEQMEKPDVDSVDGLSPAISIEQKTTTRSVRSTVGTITEIYDYLRLLFASIGLPHCPQCGKGISRQSVDQIVDRIQGLPAGTRFMILAPVVRDRKGEFRKLFEKYHREGFVRARVDGEIVPLEDPPDLERRKNHTVEVIIDRLVASKESRQRIEDSVRHSLRMAEGLVRVVIPGGEEYQFSERMACVDCGVDLPLLEPRSFSFNSKFGACPSCEGLGAVPHVSLRRLVANPDQPLDRLQLSLQNRELEHLFREALRAILDHFGLESDRPFQSLPEKVLRALRSGVDEEIAFRYGDFEYSAKFEGLDSWFTSRLRSSSSDARRQQLSSYLVDGPCEACAGSRLRPESRAVRIGQHSIADYCRLPLSKCRSELNRIVLTARQEVIAGPILQEIRQRLSFLVAVGLDYLSLDRSALTLSAGEAQRVRLATQVGTELKGVLYVLDEPSIGLHARDTHNLLRTLQRLRDLGNTILVVEHDEETIRCADHIVDLGPGAAKFGGQAVAQGDLATIQNSPASLTGGYLSGRLQIPVPPKRRSGNGKAIEVLGARHHNLKDTDVRFPLGMLITVTGVSGAGKSSLVDEVLFRALSRHLYDSLAEPGEFLEIRGLSLLDKVIEIDQAPIGRTPRSNPATYCGVFTPIRELFAVLPESKIRGYKPGRFSFNVKGGRCETCDGDGMRRIEMNFLPDVYVVCENCQGSRYNRETLLVKFRGHSIADILNMSVEEAHHLLENIPPIQAKLATLLDVGLGYITLGQSSTTLSGGEAQRVKLARELSRKSTGRTLYILDEPTTGLHFDDVKKLLDILHKLVDLGNTVIVIEHNLDVIRSSDWVIDLGPEGGEKGGRLVAEGTPEQVARVQASHTGRALRTCLVENAPPSS